MTRALSLALAAFFAAAASSVARADSIIPRDIHGVVAAITTNGVTLRNASGTTNCTYTQDSGAFAMIRMYQLTVGQHAWALCMSMDGGATWKATAIFPEAGNRTSVNGMVLQLTPSEITITTKDGVRFICNKHGADAAKFSNLSVGLQVTLTCVFSMGELRVAAVKVGPAATAVKTLTISGTVVDLYGDTLLIVRIEGFLGGGAGYEFKIPPENLAAVTALASAYGTPVTVTARASGKQWILVSVTRG